MSQIKLALIREKLATLQGEQYWRALEDVMDEPEFKEQLKNEFPDREMFWDKPIDRRDFLKFMGAAFILTGLTSCARQPIEKIIPYVIQPEEIIPGKPLFYATIMPFQGYARGVLAENHMGRPTKLEGNPKHPDSLGATDVYAQTATLGLYDPDRSKVVKHFSVISSWSSFVSELSMALENQSLKEGAGLRILTETVTSPTFAAEIQQVLTRFPKAKWHRYEPLNRDHAREGSLQALGQYADTIYDFTKADIVLSLDADFLSPSPGNLKYVREFTARRGTETMNRLYVAESTPTTTGAMADHKLPLSNQRLQNFALRIAQGLGVSSARPSVTFTGAEERWLAAVTGDLKQNNGRSLVLVGDAQPAWMHALGHAMNQALGNQGATLAYIDPVEQQPVNHTESLRELSKDMNAGNVDLLLILGGNPSYTAPADFKFQQGLEKVTLRAHLGFYEDETSAYCHWHLPEAHFLESWGDARAFNGMASIQQPMIQPLYEGKTASEVLSLLIQPTGITGYDLLRTYWKNSGLIFDFEAFWKKSLHDGFVEGSASQPKRLSVKNDISFTAPKGAGGFEAVFRPDASAFDGRFSNNGWLQELPKPITKLTWDNAVLVSPKTAESLDINNEDVLEISYQGKVLEAPIWITPGHADEAVTLPLGYGRQFSGSVGTNLGFNAYTLRTAEGAGIAAGVALKKTLKKSTLVTTQTHHRMEGRDLVRSSDKASYHPEHHAAGHEAANFYPDHYEKSEEQQWGMTINLNSCIGCNACTAACGSENNIPFVGKNEVANGREMHWIRIDRYFKGPLDNPEVAHQPVPCMHCEAAPCEPVCPVGATTHSGEGLNQMIYNRCVGTRYCSNNCPYKVRRFNFYRFSDQAHETLELMKNPDVTVRSRGVMEKCTYCVQRINVARIEAKKENRKIRDGEVKTACQQVCPAEAIAFGDIHDKDSEVTKQKALPFNYGLLTELNTRPRTTYLMNFKNLHPDLKVTLHE